MTRTRDIVGIALTAVRRNALRSALAALGIVISVAAVVATVGVGEGARVRVGDDMARLGTNLVFVHAGSARSGGRRGGAGSARTLTPADGQAVRAELGYLLQGFSAVRTSAAQVVFGGRNWATQLIGVEPDYLSARGWALQSGRNFVAADGAGVRKVCILGATVAKELFGDADPIGQTVRVRHVPCQIVGVLVRRGAGGFGQNQDDAVLLPYATLTRRVLAADPSAGLSYIAAGRSAGLTGTLEAEMRALLRQRHRLAARAPDDFSLYNLSDMQQAAGRQVRTVSLLLRGVAGIALVVGAIGIANVMLVAVTERTREIGLRMALGARGRDILLQFLLEAVALSLLGGLVGLALGYGATAAFARLVGWPQVLDATTPLVALAAAGAAGVVAGLYPAWRASRLDPIAALRAD
jgi:putative ABC transport system permease protein